jgi:hypothetical protein
MSRQSARLVSTTQEHLRLLMTWFPDAESCRLWGGTDFRHPFTEDSFVADSRCETLPSYSLVGAASCWFRACDESVLPLGASCLTGHRGGGSVPADRQAHRARCARVGAAVLAVHVG